MDGDGDGAGGSSTLDISAVLRSGVAGDEDQASSRSSNRRRRRGSNGDDNDEDKDDDDDDDDGNGTGNGTGNGEGQEEQQKTAKQVDLVRRAFAAPDDEEEDEFAQEKARDAAWQDMDAGGAKSRRTVRQEKAKAASAGWGSWSGLGAKAKKPRQKSKAQLAAEEAEKKKKKRARRDDGLSHVIINEKRNKRAAAYHVDKVPYPFTSREQYEASLRQPLGHDWNTTESHRRLTAAEVKVTAGAIIDPVQFGKKAKGLLDDDIAKRIERKKRAQRASQRKQRSIKGL